MRVCYYTLRPYNSNLNYSPIMLFLISLFHFYVSIFTSVKLFSDFVFTFLNIFAKLEKQICYAIGMFRTNVLCIRVSVFPVYLFQMTHVRRRLSGQVFAPEFAVRAAYRCLWRHQGRAGLQRTDLTPSRLFSCVHDTLPASFSDVTDFIRF